MEPCSTDDSIDALSHTNVIAINVHSRDLLYGVDDYRSVEILYSPEFGISDTSISLNNLYHLLGMMQPPVDMLVGLHPRYPLE